jgi:hypothetical protein
LAPAVAEKRIWVFNPVDPKLDDSDFRSLQSSFKDNAHACFRWSISAHDDLLFSLDLQGLPMSASAANSKQALVLDTAPTVRLASHKVAFTTFPMEARIPGPAPDIFSDDPVRSKSILTHQAPLL